MIKSRPPPVKKRPHSTQATISRFTPTCPRTPPALHCSAQMKSEHRHDLKTNDLAKSLLTAQDYVKVYGGRVLLGIAIAILIIVLIVQRSGRPQPKALKLQDDLAYANAQIARLEHAQVIGDSQVTVRPA